MNLALVILAAGKGTRMRSDLPKVLHQVAHAPLVIHTLKAGLALAPDRVVVVTGHGAQAVEDAVRTVAPMAQFVRQTEQLGTGHAVLQAREVLSGFTGQVLVLYGDSPLFRPDTLSSLVTQNQGADVSVLGFKARDPGRYGRLITKGETLQAIVEYKDCTPAQRAIDLCNSGVMAAQSTLLFEALAGLTNANASGEYYLTDVVGAACDQGLVARYVLCPEAETLGVNSRTELAQAEATFQATTRTRMIDAGVSLRDPNSVHFAHDTIVAPDVVIEQNVVFGPGVHVATGSVIRAFSHLEGADVGPGCVVGPYARLRPGTRLAQGAKIGNFVETKTAQIGEGAKVNHLSYVGDATIGRHSNIGAGTITCNYDGVFKHKTTIGDGVFVGSNTMLVAPVSLGDGSLTASGSVITRDVPQDALAIARGRQDNKDGMAKKIMDRLLKKKKGQA